jgi:hypothetical protein
VLCSDRVMIGTNLSKRRQTSKRDAVIYVLSDDEQVALDEALRSVVVSDEEVTAFWRRCGIE